MLVAAVGIDAEGIKHPLGVIEGATENAATVRALLDNLIGRGLDPAVCRLFIVDGAKALSKAIRHVFGRHTPIQRCQSLPPRRRGCTRLAIFLSASRSIFMFPCAERYARHGRWRMRTKPRN